MYLPSSPAMARISALIYVDSYRRSQPSSSSSSSRSGASISFLRVKEILKNFWSIWISVAPYALIWFSKYSSRSGAAISALR